MTKLSVTPQRFCMRFDRYRPIGQMARLWYLSGSFLFSIMATWLIAEAFQHADEHLVFASVFLG